MKKVFTGIIVLLVCGGLMLAGLTSGNIMGTYPIAFGIIILYLFRRTKSQTQRLKQHKFMLNSSRLV